MKLVGCGVLDSLALGLLVALISEESTPLYHHPALPFCKDSLVFFQRAGYWFKVP